MNNAKEILINKNLVPEYPIIDLNYEDALVSFQETMEDMEIKFDFFKLSKDELVSLFNEYANCIILYHPESYHQERGAFLKCRELLLKHGLEESDIDAIDFV